MKERIDRFDKYMKFKQLNDNQVTVMCGLSTGLLNKARSGKTDLGAKTITMILNNFQDLNRVWLLTGEGEMIQPTNETKTGKEINIIDIRVCAGTGCGFDGDENRIIATVTIPDFAGCYGVTVYGNSMHGMYNAGDIVFVRQITDVHSIENGQPYVVITREDRLLKLIHVDYANSTITLSSYNAATLPDGRRMYPDMQLGESDVLYLYKVVGRLSRTQM